MITPQLTEQYGQVLRVSVVRAIFNPCVCAYTGARLKPKTLTPAPPAKVVLMKVLLETSIASHSFYLPLVRGEQEWGMGEKRGDAIHQPGSTQSFCNRSPEPRDPKGSHRFHQR